jgi:phosphoribosylformylglycinamidine (FGAM) synthase-like amidotransferase family enzyme
MITVLPRYRVLSSIDAVAALPLDREQAQYHGSISMIASITAEKSEVLGNMAHLSTPVNRIY